MSAKTQGQGSDFVYEGASINILMSVRWGAMLPNFAKLFFDKISL